MKRKLLSLPVLIFFVVWAVFAVLPAQSKLRDESVKAGTETCATLGGCDGRFQEYYRLFGFPVSTFKLSYKDIDASCVKSKSFGMNDSCKNIKPKVILSRPGIAIDLGFLLVGLFIITRFTKRESKS